MTSDRSARASRGGASGSASIVRLFALNHSRTATPTTGAVNFLGSRTRSRGTVPHRRQNPPAHAHPFSSRAAYEVLRWQRSKHLSPRPPPPGGAEVLAQVRDRSALVAATESCSTLRRDLRPVCSAAA